MKKTSKELEDQYDRRWAKMFNEACSEFNKTHSDKIQERPENKSGFDYFSHPEVTQSVTKALGYEHKDVAMSRSRLQDTLLDAIS